ncbi:MULTISPECIES: phycobiliprotein lyase [Pseudanabaena]|uniref:Chromophore lyase CpcS/CpeS n=2 Tax=Pseudanabaena TaxID=1152 RepID=L8N0Y2_9CYAN|nr:MULTISPECIES: phycobiliprotein lyase [Pseudanabaena]ELS33857.1 Protein of unknown function CpeS/Ycf58 [Pseudanabaena biceps PCC 7429]MDG3493952.1 phycobiliprotein lyase [Pseudanabaena catenata USMAC16]
MDIHQFLELFVGRWRSQRSDHQFGEGNGNDSRSVIEITSLSLNDPELIATCQSHDIDINAVVLPIKISWEEESLNSNKPKGNALLVPVPDPEMPSKGVILTKLGKGVYEFGADEALTIQTVTAHAAIEERIWYGNPNLRFRVATLLQGDRGSDRQTDRQTDRQVKSSTFYSEIRSTAPKA